MLVVLDSGPLGLLSGPLGSRRSESAWEWADSLAAGGHELVIPELADFEVRRELLRAGLVESVRRLDELGTGLRYEPITTSAMRHAAVFWAHARNRARPTAPDHALDGDVLLAGQVATLGPDAVVATTNTKHLRRYVSAKRWDATDW